MSTTNSTAGIPNGSSNPSMYLKNLIEVDGSNFFSAKFELSYKSRSFGNAGNEVTTGFAFVNPMPMRSATVTETRLAADGTQETIIRPWETALDESGFQVFEAKSALLLVFLLNSCTDGLLIKLRATKEFAELVAATNTLGLWRLIQRTVMQNGGLGLSNSVIRGRWQELRQVNEKTGEVLMLDSFLDRFDSFLVQLQGTESEVSDSDKSMQLINAIYRKRYEQTILGIMSSQRKITYEELKDELRNLENSGVLDRLERQVAMDNTADATAYAFDKANGKKRKSNAWEGNVSNTLGK